jgi:hypothetical protein
MTRKKCPGILERELCKHEFFRGACDTNGDFFYYSWFNGNISLDSGGYGGHVSFLF